jgi:tRNA U34 5-methylaminomethyl-2-thiouridine-forming methyltransferase MnmC
MEASTALEPFRAELGCGMADALLNHWSQGGGTLALPDLEARMIVGDARITLPAWQGRADAWFLDGFAPARNPELWQEDLLQAVADHTATQGSFATYTAAGAVRRALHEAGFDVTRVAGYGRKRHMTRGVLRAR